MTVAVEGGSPDLAPGQSQQAPRQHLVAGRFRLIEQLGRGGMGRVYRAHDEVLDRPVAVKLIYDDAVRDRDLKHACALEARAAARLNHPGIVRILDSGFDDGHCYVVMSLAEGRTLAEILREDGPLPVDRALDLAIQVADALAAAHREGVIHCDVKPGNLLVDASWRVRLVDFGIARVTSSTTGLTGELLQGSAQYVAPEQVEGASVDGRTDLYALGTILYEMLAGQTPFGGGTIASILARRLVNDPPALREINPGIPPQVERVVLKALARDPEERIQTAAELRDALVAIRNAVPIFPTPPRGCEQGGRPSRWPEIRPVGLASIRPGLERTGRAMLAGAAQAVAWTVRVGRGAREATGSVVPDAMTRAHLLTPARRPTLRAGVGLAVLLGLLVGATAATCGVAGVAADAVVASEPVTVTTEQRAAATPTLVATPIEARPLAESAAPVATAPIPPTEVPPTATVPAPTPTAALAEVEAAPPPAPAPARPPVRSMSAPPPAPVAPAEPAPAPPPPPSDTAEKDDGKEKKNPLSNTPRSEEKTPEERAKADAKKREEEKRAEQAKPARASTLAPYVSKPEPTRQPAAAPKPQSAVPPPTQVVPKPEPKKPEQGPPAVKNEQPRGSEKRKDSDD
ncbi:MAG TPA: protein kinase [Chloroflexota bacterium]|nr:protein kinase [Chloroflexota bacterium]